MGHARVFVTGGSGGIGSACVRELVARGSWVCAPRKDECDVQIPAELRASLTAAAGQQDGLDAVIAAAGVRNSPDDDVLNVNLHGTLNTAREAVPFLVDGGRLVLISSVSAITPAPGRAAYAASKAGVRAVGASIRKEHRRIRVTTLVLGATDTPMWTSADTYPREKMLRSADVADAILWILERPPGVSVDELVLVPQSQDVRPPGW